MEEVAPGLGIDTSLGFREAQMGLSLPLRGQGLLDGDKGCLGVTFKACRPQIRQCLH